MAEPVVISCPADTWVKAATAVKSGTIRRKSVNPSKYLQTYRLTGEDAPTDDTDAADLFCDCDMATIGHTADIDVYVKATRKAGSVRVDL